MIASFPAAASLALLVLLAGCSRDDGEGNALAQLDAELAAEQSANAADPAAMAALQDQIMVDPTLTAQADRDAVRPPARPYSGALPQDDIAAGSAMPATGDKLMTAPAPTARPNQAAREAITLGALAARQPGQAGANCTARLQYSAGWARRLPADLPLYPDARVTEAAGAQGNGCALRVVSFYAAKPMQAMLDWYYTQAKRGGYSAEHQVDDGTHMLGGARGRDRAAYVLFLTERGDGGTDIDMVANNGV